MEVNLAGGRKTRIRADTIAEVRDDFVSEGKGKERKPIVRIIMLTGANIIAEGETLDEFWRRLNESLQTPLHFIPAPEVGDDGV
jgi:hypothetical protein